MEKKREPGYYFVKFKDDPEWVVCQYRTDIGWWIPGSIFLRQDSDFEEIDERPITRDR